MENIETLQPENFEIEYNTIWSFPRRGNWATHKGDYRGNWAPEIPRNIISRYSDRNDIIVDPFVGSGTTLVECKLLERNGIGFDVNPEACEVAEERLDFEVDSESEQEIHHQDARNLSSVLGEESADLICGHPPYWNIIEYTEEEKNDLSRIGEKEEFLDELSKVAEECYEVLKPDKYCAILAGDARENKHVIPLGFKIMQVFLDAGFVNKEIILKEQHNCKATGFWKERSKEFNFLLLAHEYLFVFRKPGE